MGYSDAASKSLKALFPPDKGGSEASSRVLQRFLKKLPLEGSGKLTWFKCTRVSPKKLRGVRWATAWPGADTVD